MVAAAALENAIDGLLNGFVNSKSAALCAALVPIALTGVTIYIITMGWAVMRGETNDSFHTILWKFFKIAVITGIALSAGEFQTTVIQGVNGIEGAFISVFSNVNTMGALVDTATTPFSTLYDQLMSNATTGVIPIVSLVIAAIIVVAAQIFLAIVGLGMYLLAKVSLALVLAVGPAFILCSLFPSTQRFTESWLSQVISFVLLKVMIVTCFAMLGSFAIQLAAAINANVGNTQILLDVTALLIVCITLGVIMLNLETIAAALSGGASINGVGRFVAGMIAMYLFKRKPSKSEKQEPNEIKNDSKTPSQQNSTPLAQRNVLDNIRQSSI